MIRVDDPNHASARLKLAENLPAIPPGDATWTKLFKLRNPTESLNSRLKQTFSGTRDRAPAVGAANNLFDLLCLAVYTNFVAAQTHAARLRQIAV